METRCRVRALFYIRRKLRLECLEICERGVGGLLRSWHSVLAKEVPDRLLFVAAALPVQLIAVVLPEAQLASRGDNAVFSRLSFESVDSPSNRHVF